MDEQAEEMPERPSVTVSPALESASATKLFLGGLSWQTTDEKLRTYFTRFGPLEDAVVMTDRTTKLPRGFGFVTFKDPAAAQRAIDSGPHSIDERLIDCKPSIPQGMQQPAHANRSRKIFVGGLSPDTTEEEFRAYFGAYGNVVEAQIMIDPTTNRPRGFGFVTFEDEESVHRVFGAGTIHILSGKQVEVKAATPKGSGPQGPSALAARASMAGALAAMPPGWPRYTQGARPPGRYTQPAAGYGYTPMAAGQVAGQIPYGMAPMGGYGMPPGSYGYAYPVPAAAYGAPYAGQYMAGYPGMMAPPGGPYPGPYSAYGPPAYPAPYPGSTPTPPPSMPVPVYPAPGPSQLPGSRRPPRPAVVPTVLPLPAGAAAIPTTTAGPTPSVLPQAAAAAATAVARPVRAVIGPRQITPSTQAPAGPAQQPQYSLGPGAAPPAGS